MLSQVFERDCCLHRRILLCDDDDDDHDHGDDDEVMTTTTMMTEMIVVKMSTRGPEDWASHHLSETNEVGFYMLHMMH